MSHVGNSLASSPNSHPEKDYKMSIALELDPLFFPVSAAIPDCSGNRERPTSLCQLDSNEEPGMDFPVAHEAPANWVSKESDAAAEKQPLDPE